MPALGSSTPPGAYRKGKRRKKPAPSKPSLWQKYSPEKQPRKARRAVARGQARGLGVVETYGPKGGGRGARQAAKAGLTPTRTKADKVEPWERTLMEIKGREYAPTEGQAFRSQAGDFRTTFEKGLGLVTGTDAEGKLADNLMGIVTTIGTAGAGTAVKGAARGAAAARTALRTDEAVSAGTRAVKAGKGAAKGAGKTPKPKGVPKGTPKTRPTPKKKPTPKLKDKANLNLRAENLGNRAANRYSATERRLRRARRQERAVRTVTNPAVAVPGTSDKGRAFIEGHLKADPVKSAVTTAQALPATFAFATTVAGDAIEAAKTGDTAPLKGTLNEAKSAVTQLEPLVSGDADQVADAIENDVGYVMAPLLPRGLASAPAKAAARSVIAGGKAVGRQVPGATPAARAERAARATRASPGRAVAQKVTQRGKRKRTAQIFAEPLHEGTLHSAHARKRIEKPARKVKDNRNLANLRKDVEGADVIPTLVRYGVGRKNPLEGLRRVLRSLDPQDSKAINVRAVMAYIEENPAILKDPQVWKTVDQARAEIKPHETSRVAKYRGQGDVFGVRPPERAVPMRAREHTKAVDRQEAWKDVEGTQKSVGELRKEADRIDIEARVLRETVKARVKDLRRRRKAAPKKKASTDVERWDSKGMIAWVPIEELRRFRESDAKPSQELVDSIKKDGVETPLTLEYNHSKGTAHLGEGNHRLNAAEAAGLTHVPVLGYSSIRKSRAERTVPGRLAEQHGNTPQYFNPADIGIKAGKRPGATRLVEDPILNRQLDRLLDMEANARGLRAEAKGGSRRAKALRRELDPYSRADRDPTIRARRGHWDRALSDEYVENVKAAASEAESRAPLQVTSLEGLKGSAEEAALQRTVAAIARVHDASDLAPVRLRHADAGTIGPGKAAWGGVPGDIQVHAGRGSEWEIAHELGHHTEYFSKQGGDAVVKAAARSALMRKMAKRDLDPEYREYYFDPGETFARAYGQWIASRSRDAKLLEGMKRARTKNMVWSDADFQPIAAELDKMFRGKGKPLDFEEPMWTAEPPHSTDPGMVAGAQTAGPRAMHIKTGKAARHDVADRSYTGFLDKTINAPYIRKGLARGVRQFVDEMSIPKPVEGKMKRAVSADELAGLHQKGLFDPRKEVAIGKRQLAIHLKDEAFDPQGFHSDITKQVGKEFDANSLVPGESYVIVKREAGLEFMDQVNPTRGALEAVTGPFGTGSARILLNNPAWLASQGVATGFQALATMGFNPVRMARELWHLERLRAVDPTTYERLQAAAGAAGPSIDTPHSFRISDEPITGTKFRRGLNSTFIGRRVDEIATQRTFGLMDRWQTGKWRTAALSNYLRKSANKAERARLAKGAAPARFGSYLGHRAKLAESLRGKSRAEQEKWWTENPQRMETEIRKLNETMGDWHTYSRFEKAFAGLFIFYPFVRMSLTWPIRFAKHHPAVAESLYLLGQANNKELEKALGDEDLAYLEYANAVVHGGPDGEVSATLPGARRFQSPGLNVVTEAMASQNTAGVVRALNPVLSTLVYSATHTDPFTGEKTDDSFLEGMGHQLASLPPAFRALDIGEDEPSPISEAIAESDPDAKYRSLLNPFDAQEIEGAREKKKIIDNLKASSAYDSELGQFLKMVENEGEGQAIKKLKADAKAGKFLSGVGPPDPTGDEEFDRLSKIFYELKYGTRKAKRTDGMFGSGSSMFGGGGNMFGGGGGMFK